MKISTLTQGLAPAALKHSGILAPLLLCAAMTTTVFAVRQGVELAKPKAKPTVIVKKEYVTGDKLAEVITRMARDNPGVEIKPAMDGKSIMVSGKEIGSYTDFIYALSTTSGIEKGVFWEASIVCLNDCPTKVAVFAQISGYKQLIFGG